MIRMSKDTAPSTPKSVYEFAVEERKFLHDLANPLAIATGMFEAYRDELERSGHAPSEALTRKLAKLDTALQRIGDLVTNHRLRLLQIQENEQKNKP